MANTTETQLKIQPIKLREIGLWIKSTTPLIQHAWSEKAMRMMRMTAQERRRVPKDARDPEAEGMAAIYRTEDGGYGIPAMAIKSALVSAAHKDFGLPKTEVRKALRFPSTGNLPMETEDPIIREDIVRVGAGATDIRYRPEFASWRLFLRFNFDADLVTSQDILNLVDRAGFAVGIGEMRPEKDGEFGCFEVDRDEEIRETVLAN